MTASSRHGRARSPAGRASPAGILLHSPGHYDFQVWLALRGREGALREAIVRRARLEPGEAVLDVGCGTGTLAVAAGRRVGPTGAVFGVDASQEMVAAARAKARRAGVEIDVQEAAGQALPFPDGRFDVVTSTLMLHHLPREGREACAREMARVLKPGGRALAVDFASSSQTQGGLFSRLHRHGFVRLDQIVGLLVGAGLTVLESGPMGVRDLHYVLAAKPQTTP